MPVQPAGGAPFNPLEPIPASAPAPPSEPSTISEIASSINENFLDVKHGINEVINAFDKFDKDKSYESKGEAISKATSFSGPSSELENNLKKLRDVVATKTVEEIGDDLEKNWITLKKLPTDPTHYDLTELDEAIKQVGFLKYYASSYYVTYPDSWGISNDLAERYKNARDSLGVCFKNINEAADITKKAMLDELNKISQSLNDFKDGKHLGLTGQYLTRIETPEQNAITNATSRGNDRGGQSTLATLIDEYSKYILPGHDDVIKEVESARKALWTWATEPAAYEFRDLYSNPDGTLPNASTVVDRQRSEGGHRLDNLFDLINRL